MSKLTSEQFTNLARFFKERAKLPVRELYYFGTDKKNMIINNGIALTEYYIDSENALYKKLLGKKLDFNTFSKKAKFFIFPDSKLDSNVFIAKANQKGFNFKKTNDITKADFIIGIDIKEIINNTFFEKSSDYHSKMKFNYYTYLTEEGKPTTSNFLADNKSYYFSGNKDFITSYFRGGANTFTVLSNKFLINIFKIIKYKIPIVELNHAFNLSIATDITKPEVIDFLVDLYESDIQMFETMMLDSDYTNPKNEIFIFELYKKINNKVFEKVSNKNLYKILSSFTGLYTKNIIINCISKLDETDILNLNIYLESIKRVMMISDNDVSEELSNKFLKCNVETIIDETSIINYLKNKNHENF